MSNTLTKLRNTSHWRSLICENLSKTNTSESILLAQFHRVQNNNILFNLREYYKGRPTEVGFTLTLCEYRWLIQTLLNSNKSIYILEHNNRTITVDKTIEDHLITVTKSNGQIKKMLINFEQILQLLSKYNEMEEVLEKKENNLNFEPSQNDFFRVTIK